VNYDTKDRITYLILSVQTATTDTTTKPDDAAAGFFSYVLRKLYPPDLADSAVAWITAEKDATHEHDLGGTTIRTYGADAHTRNVDIRSPWG
jgi:hypothetical protein